MKVYTIRNESVSVELDSVHDWQLDVLPHMKRDIYSLFTIKTWLRGKPVVEATYRQISGEMDYACDMFGCGFDAKIVCH